jgi:Fe-S-cluster containining protein
METRTLNEPIAEAVIPLTISGRQVRCNVSVPMRDMRVFEAMPVFHTLCDTVVSVALQSIAETGKTVSCGPGCGVCCQQVVPVSRGEAVYLRQCLATLPRERQETLRRRFTDACVSFESEGLLAQLRTIDSLLDRQERQDLGIRYFGLGISCPFLENGSCSIYPWRPMACREYLVTSPAPACASPSSSTIAMVPLPVKPSNVIFRFDDGTGLGRTVWRPLTLLQDPAVLEDPESFPLLPGPRLIENFLKCMTRNPSAKEGDMLDVATPLRS